MQNSTIDQEEINKFTKMADEWWDFNGKFKPLHAMNPVRIGFIKDNVIKNLTKQKEFKHFSLLDIGCGGGLITEPFSKMGFNVTGIDASETNINIAKSHAKELKINYNFTSAEKLANTNIKFNIVLALEILEHVNNIELFIDSCTKLLQDNGLLFFSTINKNISSFLHAIIGAEYILRWLPIGTHKWDKFIKPSTIVNLVDKYNMNILDIKGMKFDIFNQNWYISDDPSLNYIMALQKI